MNLLYSAFLCITYGSCHFHLRYICIWESHLWRVSACFSALRWRRCPTWCGPHLPRPYPGTSTTHTNTNRLMLSHNPQNTETFTIEILHNYRMTNSKRQSQFAWYNHSIKIRHLLNNDCARLIEWIMHSSQNCSRYNELNSCTFTSISNHFKRSTFMSVWKMEWLCRSATEMAQNQTQATLCSLSFSLQDYKLSRFLTDRFQRCICRFLANINVNQLRKTKGNSNKWGDSHKTNYR